MIHLVFKDFRALWFKFRDHQPENYKDIHLVYCEKITQAIGANDLNEALRVLVDGILYFNLNKGDDEPADPS